MDDLELFVFSDSSWVIVGGHVSVEKAQELVADEFDPDAVVKAVQHFWVRWEWMSDEDIDDQFTADPNKRPQWWVLYEQTNRPKGVVKRATVVVPR